MLEDAGLAEFDKVDVAYYPKKVTWEGHEFLDSVRDSKTWSKTKEGALAAGGFTIDLLKGPAKGFAKKQIEERTGVQL